MVKEMTWTETQNKYKDSELMKEFWVWYFKQSSMIFTPETTQLLIDNIRRIHKKSRNIKDIWGYLICFAATKGYELSISHCVDNWWGDIFALKEDINIVNETGKGYAVEQAMLWCASKFFEVAC